MFVASALLLLFISTAVAQNIPPAPRYYIFDEEIGICEVDSVGNCAQRKPCKETLTYCAANKLQLDENRRYAWFCECLRPARALEQFLRKSRERDVTPHNYRLWLIYFRITSQRLLLIVF